MDPDNGAKPPAGGASATANGEGRSSRRKKAKRHGKRRDAAQVTHSGPADPAAQAARPPSKEPSPSARKRKRRRAKTESASRQPLQETAPEAKGSKPVSIRPVQAAGKDEPQPNPQRSSRQRRRKNRAGRGLQGRPLTAGKAAPATLKGPHAAPPPSPAGIGGAASGDILAKGLPFKDPGAAEASGKTVGVAPASDAQGQKPFFIDDLYAALDLGTNNCRLLIAQPTRPGQFRVVDAFSRIVRLGEGLGASGRLSPDAMDRAIEALRICAAKLAQKPVRRMRLIATEACRAAGNGEEFLTRVTTETGLQLEIIDRETEARLAVSGCSSLVGREARSVVLFDIGGGSSEIAVIRIGDNRSSRLANHITHWTSLPVGVVTLSERHGGRDVTPDVFAAMVAEVEAMLAVFECPPVGTARRAGAEDFHLIGTSGTVTTLAGVHLDLPRYDRRKVDGLWLSDAEVSAMQAKLLSWDFAGRAANPCIGPDRADLVLAGCAILEAIRRRWPSQRMRVADRGLREGLLTDMMADDGVWRRLKPRRPGAGQGPGGQGPGGQGSGGRDEAGARR